MKVTVRKAIEILDATDPRNIAQFDLEPGEYLLEKGQNPDFPIFRAEWLFVKGTKKGATERWWIDSAENLDFLLDLKN